jgi:hypothetical protein
MVSECVLAGRKAKNKSSRAKTSRVAAEEVEACRLGQRAFSK